MLEQPFILPTRALEGQDPVNYNLFTHFKKQDIDQVGNRAASTNGARTVQHVITWMPNPNSQEGQVVTWRYPNQSCRDQDYSELLSKICVPLGPNNT